MALPRKIHLPAIGSLPSNIDPTLLRFCQAVKELNAIGEGINTEHLLEKKVTRRDLEALGIDSSVIDNDNITYVFPGGGDATGLPPGEPTNFIITQRAFSNRLAWTNPSNVDLSSINVWYSPDNSTWTLVAIVTSPTSVFNHSLLEYYNENQYYRIQAVNTEGLVSGFVTENVSIIVKDTINELTDLLFGTSDYYTHQYNIIADSFLFSQPSEHIKDWVVTSNYLEGDLVLYGSTAVGVDIDPSNAYTASVDVASGGTSPDLNPDWLNLTIGELAGLATTRPLLKLGYVDNQPTMGLRGDFIVDGGILARTISAADIFTNHLSSVNYVAGVSGYFLDAGNNVAEFNNIQMVLNWGTDVVGTDIPAANATVGATWGSDIADPAGTMPADGADVTNYSDLRITNATYIDPSVWVLGTSGTQGDFIYYGVSTQSEIKSIVGPFGILETCWECISDGSYESGGWKTDPFTVDPAKSYRVTVWAKQTTTSGAVYIGLGTCYNLDGTENTNPYFWSGDLPSNNTWYLLVGILHPQGYTGAGEGVAGVYDLLTGDRVIAGTEFKSNGATTQRHRALIAGTPVAGELKHFTRPRFEEINGNEPSLIELMGSADVTSANTSLDTSNVNGTPAATVQANALNAITAANNQSADGILSTQEKATWRVQWPSMLANHDSIISQATTYGIEANAEFVDFTSDKDTLSGYLTTTLTVWSLPDTPATISPDTQLTDYVTLFYDAMQACVNSLADYSPQNSVDAGLDTTTGGLIVRNQTTQDYAHLTAGDLNFFYWNGVSHELYQSVNRLESGVVLNADTVLIPGIFKDTPTVMISPATLQTYSSLSTGDQRLNLLTGPITEQVAGSKTWQFTPTAVLETDPGESLTGLSTITLNCNSAVTASPYYYYASGSSSSSPGATEALRLAGSAGLTFSVEAPSIALSARADYYIYLVIDGTTYLMASYSKTLTATAWTTASWSGSMSVNNRVDLPPAIHSSYLYLKTQMTSLNTGVTANCDISPVTFSMGTDGLLLYATVDTVDVLATGSLNWLATGQ